MARVERRGRVALGRRFSAAAAVAVILALSGARSPAAPEIAPGAPDSPARVVGVATAPGGGYWAALAGGTVLPVGRAASFGEPADRVGSATWDETTAIASDPAAPGYWLLDADGNVQAFGAARSFGSRSLHDAVAIAGSPGGEGYWVVTSLGHVFAFGGAPWVGSAADRHLASPVVGIASAPSGRGYWLVTRQGQVLGYGDVAATSSEPAVAPGASVVGVAVAPGGGGLWLATSAGAVLTTGDASWHGDADGELHGAAVVGFAGSGQGYWMLASDGEVWSFDAPALPPLAIDGLEAAPLPPAAVPTRSIPPPAGFSAACSGVGPVAACNRLALGAIDAARATEGYGPLVLPHGFAGLGPAAQILAVANAERTSRGLPALPQSAPLDALAEQGAVAGEDPTGPPSHSWASNIAWGYRTALAADYVWMYDDGPGGPNVDCTRAGEPGCWGHRRNVLSPWGGTSGAAALPTPEGWVLTELFVAS